MKTFSRIALYAVLVSIAALTINLLPDAASATADMWR